MSNWARETIVVGVLLVVIVAALLFAFGGAR